MLPARTCPPHYCIFNQQKGPGIILIALASPGIYSSLFHRCSGGAVGRVERIHVKFAHLAVAGDRDSDSTQLAHSPPLSSLILAGGDLAHVDSAGMTVWAHSRCLLPPTPLISKLLIPALSPVNDYLTITYLTSEICVTAALWRQLSATNAIHKLLPGRCANPPPPSLRISTSVGKMCPW